MRRDPRLRQGQSAGSTADSAETTDSPTHPEDQLAPIVPNESFARAWFRLLRPRQWAKNALLLLPFAFTVDLAWDLSDPSRALALLKFAGIAFLAFCALASAGYIINDLLDMTRDRAHPSKRFRPLASGRVSPTLAVLAATFLFVVSVVGTFAINIPTGLVGVGYVVLTLGYSALLKHVLILDVIAVAGGYVLRVFAGAVAIDVPISPWLYLCTILGALFIAIAKRRAEVQVLEGAGPDHRPILDGYTLPLLDQFNAVVMPSTLMAYALYTFTAVNLPDQMMLTIPFVIYGIFRYLYLSHAKGLGGAPEEVLLKDPPLLLTVAGWVVASISILIAFHRP
jgi:4-hydroxybenzoate polyprenyltransferase